MSYIERLISDAERNLKASEEGMTSCEKTDTIKHHRNDVAGWTHILKHLRLLRKK